MIDFRQGDNRVQLRRMIDAGEFVHSVVTDPPYGLVSVAKRFGGKNAAPAGYGSDGAFQRQSKGCMGKLWDGSGIERDPEFWRLVHDVMLPGAYIVAFSSSRTYGYMQIAMEVAGFITHPMLGWTFASGFPKAHNAARAIDKTLGVESPVVGFDEQKAKQQTRAVDTNAYGDYAGNAGDIRAPGSPEAQQWAGWAYGGQALKPALEPIYVGQKPFSEKNGALNILKHGVGAMNIDGCRVPTTDGQNRARVNSGGKGNGGVYGESVTYDSAHNDTGRHPANLLHDGSDEVIALFPISKGQQGDVRGTEPSRTGDENTVCYGEFGRVPAAKRGDTDGSAARFFNSFSHEGPLLHYPKAGKKDRAGSKHATVKPVALMRHLVRLVTPLNGIVLDPFAGTGTTGQAALDEGMQCVLLEAELEYARDIRRRFSLPETVSDKLVNLLEAMS